MQTAQHPQSELAARSMLAAAISRARIARNVKGDQLVALHDAARGRADADKAKDSLAAQLALAFRGSVIEFCAAVKKDVPSAKPCRMALPEGMKDKATRGELRAGHISAWGWDKLCAVANSLDHDVIVTLRPRTPAAV